MTGLSILPKPWDLYKVQIGRGAFHRRRRDTGRSPGAYGSENAGMSSEKHVRTMFIEISKVSDVKSICVGLVGT